MKFPDLVHAVKPEPHHAMPQAATRARHVLGLRLADARDHAHADVGDVGPRDPAQLSHDAGLRRAHLPPRQRSRRVAFREVPLEAGRRHAFAGLGRGGEDLRRRSRLPSPRSVGSDRGRRLSRVGARRAGLHRGAGRALQLRRARRDQDRARGAGAADAGRPDGAQPQSRTTSSPRPSRWPSAPRTSCPASTSSNDPLLAGRIHSYVDTQISRLGGPNFHEIPINAPVAQVHNNQRDGMHRQAIHRGRVAYEPNSLGGGCPFQAGAHRLHLVRRQDGARGQQGARQAREVRRALHAGALFFNSQTPTRAGAHHQRVPLRAVAGADARGPRADGLGPDERRSRVRRSGGRPVLGCEPCQRRCPRCSRRT